MMARLTEGPDKLIKLVRRQRKEMTKLVRQRQGAPEVRIKDIDNAGNVKLKFSADMNFPEGTF